MRRHLYIALLCLVSSHGWASSQLTPTETRWLNAGDAIIAYAEEKRLPLDIIVQPQTKSGDVPLAMGFDGGRCKLVLTLRDNPDAESLLANLDPAVTDIVIEAMMAHEIAHCWRYLQGFGMRIGSRFAPASQTHEAADVSMHFADEMQQTRREEGFADLVGLAWTLRRHPRRYAEVHEWLTQVRRAQPLRGAHHDTLKWIDLAQDSAAFAADRSPFEQAELIYRQGLMPDDDARP